MRATHKNEVLSGEIMNREEILNKVRNCTPQLGWDSVYPDLYGKYGMTICGICDGWHWFEEDNITETARKNGHLPLTDASDIELLEMWAIADNYWLSKYQEWFKRSEEKSSKLDRFIGECERKYFGYDDRYTDKTIERIFNSVFEILDNQSKYLDDYYTRTLKQVNNLVDKYKTELEFTRKFIHEHGLEFALASAWDKYKN